jgi:hypothetical protein
LLVNDDFVLMTASRKARFPNTIRRIKLSELPPASFCRGTP